MNYAKEEFGNSKKSVKTELSLALCVSDTRPFLRTILGRGKHKSFHTDRAKREIKFGLKIASGPRVLIGVCVTDDGVLDGHCPVSAGQPVICTPYTVTLSPVWGRPSPSTAVVTGHCTRFCNLPRAVTLCALFWYVGPKRSHLPHPKAMNRDSVRKITCCYYYYYYSRSTVRGRVTRSSRDHSQRVPRKTLYS